MDGVLIKVVTRLLYLYTGPVLLLCFTMYVNLPVGIVRPKDKEESLYMLQYCILLLQLSNIIIGYRITSLKILLSGETFGITEQPNIHRHSSMV